MVFSEALLLSVLSMHVDWLKHVVGVDSFIIEEQIYVLYAVCVATIGIYEVG